MTHFQHIASTYNEYYETLYSYALHMGFDKQTAMDAIHDVFYKLCIHHSSLSEISNMKFYLIRSLQNRLIDIKRNDRESAVSVSSQDEIQKALPFQLQVTVEDKLIMKEDAEEICRKVEAVLSRLTDHQREIVYMRYIKEQSYVEIAEIMQISIASCRNLISKSLTKLKESSLPVSY